MKKWLKTALALCLIMSLIIVPVSAAENMTEEILTQQQMQAEIEQETARRMETIYSQMTEQEAERHAYIYEGIIRAQVELQVQMRYGVSSASVPPMSAYAPYGGLVSYYVPSGEPGKEGCDVVITALDQINSYYYILLQNSFNTGDILMDILGYIPLAGDILNIIRTLEGYREDIGYSSVLEADGYAQIIQIYDREFESADFPKLTGWFEYPYIAIDTSLNPYSLEFTAFDEYYPFDKDR